MRTETRISGRAVTCSAIALSGRPRGCAGQIMDSSFDPLYTWLGIPPQEQPPDHYRLLGVQRFEENREVISHAADQRMAHVRSFQNGPHARDTQRIMNELSKASGCLLNPRRKAMYDQHLRSVEVTAKAEEARLPPSTPAMPTVKVRVAGANVPTVPVVSSRPSANPVSRSAGRRMAFPLLAIAATVLVGSFAAWWYFAGSGDESVAQQPENRLPLPESTNAGSTVAGGGEPGSNSANSGNTESGTAPQGNSTTRPAVTSPTSESPQLADLLPPGGQSGTTGAPGSAETGVNPAGQVSASQSPASENTPSSSQPAGVNRTEASSAALVKGKPKGLHFSTGDRIEITNSVGLIDPRKEWTIELWARFAPEQSAHWLLGDLIIGPNHPEVPNGLVTGWQFFIQQTVASRHRTAFSTRDGYAGDAPVRVGEWRHLAVTNDGRELVVHVDGRRVATGDVTRLQGAFIPSPIPIFFGAHGHMHANQPPGFAGDLRSLRISSSCRYRSEFTPPATFPVDDSTELTWDFAQSMGATVLDFSRHARHGKISGATWFALPDSAVAVAATPSPSTPSTPSATPAPAVPAPAEAATAAMKLEEVRPIPDEVALVQARAKIRQVFEDDFKRAKESKQLLALAEKLLALAAESADDHAGRYAMYEEAQRLAAQAGDLKKALAIVDDWSRRFDIRAFQLKAAAVSKCADVLKTVGDRRQLAELALGLSDECRLSGNFETAEDLAQLATTTATRLKDAELGKSARECRDLIVYSKKRLPAAKEAERQLAAQPDDLAASLEWGRFLCFCQGNWDQGLPFLTRGGNTPLAVAAKQDLAAPGKPDEQTALAKAWLAAVKGVEAGEREAVQLRALHWLREAESQAKGLTKADVEQRIKELEQSISPRHRPAAKVARAAGATFQPPAEFVGMPGRVLVNQADVGILWKYEHGLRLTQANVASVLAQANVPRGKLKLEFVGVLQLPESASVTFNHVGGSAQGTATLLIDNKAVGEVGGNKGTSANHRLELNAGEHTVRWILSGDDLGTNVLQCAHAATGQPIVFYHTPAILNLVRTTPSPARLNVNMARN